MGLIREPKNVDLSIKSEPWTEKELAELREIMRLQKQKKLKRVPKSSTKKSKKQYA